MSDILIKNMKMPENCLHCGFSHMASDCLKIWIICKPKDISVTDGDAVKDGRPDWCPLVEVSEDVQPVKHGRWISIGHKLSRICSVCYGDEPYKFADDDANVYDYCPRCGARMDGET